MRTYTCPFCKSHFSEADKQWDVAMAFEECPDCREPLRDFPSSAKATDPKPAAQQTWTQQGTPHNYQRPKRRNPLHSNHTHGVLFSHGHWWHSC